MEQSVKFVIENLEKSAKVLDLGCGDRADIKNLERFGFECVGVDLSTGTDLNLPYLSKEAPYDLVMSNFVLHFLDNQSELIKTAYNNLGSGGKFYFQDLARQKITGDKYLSLEDATDLLKQNGFKVLSSRKYDYYDSKEGHNHWHIIMEIVALKV